MTSRRSAIISVLAIVVAIPAQVSARKPGNSRDEVLQRISACLKRDEVASKECSTLNADLDLFVAMYRQGDKSVLPTLLKFPYLTDFYAEALTASPEEFLANLARLPENETRDVLFGIGGQSWGLRRRDRFDAIRAALQAIPPMSANYNLAQRCLHRVEALNADFLLEYFPPQIFADKAGSFRVHWYSSEMYALREKPLWPPAPDLPRTYRLTILPAFSPPKAVTLIVWPDGNADVAFRKTDKWHENLELNNSRRLSSEMTSKILSHIERAGFWQMPVDINRRGLDGAVWILEGSDGGAYHVVTRWCPEKTPFAELSNEVLRIGESDQN